MQKRSAMSGSFTEEVQAVAAMASLPPPPPAALPRSTNSRPVNSRRGLALQPGDDDVVDMRQLGGAAQQTAAHNGSASRGPSAETRPAASVAGSGSSFERPSHTSAVLHSPATPRRRKTLYVRCSEGLLGLAYVGVVVISALMLWYLVEQGSEVHILAWAVGGIFVALSLPISVHDIHMHCTHYVSPMQKVRRLKCGTAVVVALHCASLLRPDHRLPPRALPCSTTSASSGSCRSTRWSRGWRCDSKTTASTSRRLATRTRPSCSTPSFR